MNKENNLPVFETGCENAAKYGKFFGSAVNSAALFANGI